MPIRKIEVLEYECAKCHYRWINRYNGKDRSIPKRCAKCKHKNWSEGLMSDKEVALRRIIKTDMHHNYKIPNCNEFLRLVPRPTIEELQTVLDMDKDKEFFNTHNNSGRIEQYQKHTERIKECMQKVIDSRK